MATKFSKDELVPPSWLDKAFFTRALRSHKLDASIEVTDVQLTPGTAAGEHYASVMFKAAIEYSSSDGDASFKAILKTYPEEDGIKAEFLKTSPAFKNEARMYSVILPEMERVLRIAGDSTVFAPPLVYQNTTTEKAPVIVFEDISPDGFRSFEDAIENWEQVQLIVRRLAKYHALSMYLHENGFPLAEFTEHYWIEAIEDESSFCAKFLKPSFVNMITAMEKWEGFEELFKKLNNQYGHLSQEFLRIIRNPITFSVLNHGDFHAKNMMFRNDGLEDEDLIFVDFQFPVWSSPSLDFTFVFNLLISDGLDDVRHNDIVLVYYKEFHETLTKINYRGKVPSLLDLKLAILAGTSLDVLLTTLMIPPRFFNWRDIDLDEMLAAGQDYSEAVGKKAYDIPEFREFIMKRFKTLEATGVLDY